MMVDILGAFVVLTTIIYTTSILVFFKRRQDFTGLATGLAIASITVYLGKNLIWGISQTLVT